MQPVSLQRVKFHAMVVRGCQWLRCTLCVVIFGRTYCALTVHLIIFCPYKGELRQWGSQPYLSGGGSKKIFAFSSWFSPSFPRFLAKVSLSGGTLPPLTPQWLCHWPAPQTKIKHVLWAITSLSTMFWKFDKHKQKLSWETQICHLKILLGQMGLSYWSNQYFAYFDQ